MDLQGWAAFATILAALLANFVMLSRGLARLDAKIDGVDAKAAARAAGLDAKLESKFSALDAKFESKIGSLDEKFESKIGSLDEKFESKFDGLDSKIDAVRDELKAEMRDGFAKTESRLITLEQRTYDLSLRLPPAPTAHTG